MSIVADAPGQFDAIPRKVRRRPWFRPGSSKRYLGARNQRIPWPEYTSDHQKEHGPGEHFQGVARVGRHLIVAAGRKPSPKEYGSQLVVIEMGSRSLQGVWSLPGYERGKEPPPPGHDGDKYSYEAPLKTDRVVGWVDVDRKLWHAGGIQAADGVVGIPIYDEDVAGSEIRFFDFHDPGMMDLVHAGDWIHPRYDHANWLRRPLIPSLDKPTMQAKAVGMARTPRTSRSAHAGWTLLVWDDLVLHFHQSIGTDIRAGFQSDPFATLPKERLPGNFRPSGTFFPGTYQSINLVTGRAGGTGPESLYLIAGRNATKLSPTVPGWLVGDEGGDYLDLYRLTVNGATVECVPTPSQTPGRGKQMYCYNQQANFGAGIGVHVQDAENLWLYAIPHWLHHENRRFNFNEYVGPSE